MGKAVNKVNRAGLIRANGRPLHISELQILT